MCSQLPAAPVLSRADRRVAEREERLMILSGQVHTGPQRGRTVRGARGNLKMFHPGAREMAQAVGCFPCYTLT